MRRKENEKWLYGIIKRFGIVYLVQEKIILLHVRHTLNFNPFSFSAKQQREITSFWVQFYGNTKLNLSFVAFTSI